MTKNNYSPSPESKIIETFKLPNSGTLSLNENMSVDISTYKAIFTTKNNELIYVNLSEFQLQIFKRII